MSGLLAPENQACDDRLLRFRWVLFQPANPSSDPVGGDPDPMNRSNSNLIKGRLWQALPWCVLITALSVCPVSAQYHFDVWTTDNGLPQNSVSSIAQSDDGYLWFTTYGGLVRYDGVHFTVFDASNISGLKNSRFSRVFSDHSGNLWITNELGMLLRYRDGAFTAYTTDDGLPDNHVLNIRDDEGGAVVFETSHGLAWWNNGKFTSQDPIGNRPFSGFGFPVRPGLVWYFDNGAFHRVESGQVTTNISTPDLTFHDIKTLYEDRLGQLWIGTGEKVIRFRNGQPAYYSQKDGLPERRVDVITGDDRGNIWIGLSDGGLFRFADGKFTRFTKADGLAGDDILTIYEDREGTLWIGSSTGLSRLGDQIITSYSTANGLSVNNTYPIYQDHDGTVWIGGFRGLTKYKDGVFTKTDRAEWVTALMEDREGGMWVGSWGGGARRLKEGKVTSFLIQDGMPDNVVRAIVQDRQSTMWFGTNAGLAAYKDGRFKIYNSKNGLPANQVCAIFEDTRGVLWIGTELGLCRFEDGQFTSYPNERALSGRIVRAFYEDSEGTLWIGTYDDGLVRLKEGKFTSYTTNEGLFNNGVFQILEDARENLWISCNLGIYRVSKKELNDYAEGRARSITSIPYGKRDGMLSSECNGGMQPTGIKARDGKLWFPTQGGVAVVDPNVVPVSPQLPPVTVEEVLLDNQAAPLQGPIRVRPGIENFEIHYTALSFIMSDRIEFKYKLEGLDTDWVAAGTRRVAYYSHVPPGTYTFRVIAANRDGIWNMEGATLRIGILYPFYRTWWFVSLSAAAFAGIGLLGYRFRVSQLEKERRAQEAFSQQLITSQEAERQRIAAELHDGLGQHLLIIKNSALLGLIALQQQDRGRDLLDDISTTASHAIDEVREISYNLRPYQLDDLGLTKALEFILAKVAASSTISFSSDIEVIDDLFSPEAEINIYRIAQETLNNIVKHSGATRASVTVQAGKRCVDITIQDNGRGFDPGNVAPGNHSGGFGLKGISERARMLGARYVLQSVAGQGTTVNLSLDIDDARAHNE
jgi:signal transduction histidine kinase/ligand-binding sensor domain-containing protein